MKIKYMLTVAAIVAVTQGAFAQYSADALKYSQFQIGSTARIKAIGNAGTAIGGDMTSISGNPAGLGFFTKSELSITPEFNMMQGKSTYFSGNTTTNNATSNNLNFNNASVVFTTKVNKPREADKTQGWLSVNFGVSYNRTNDYYGNLTYGGTNNKNSIADYFKQLGDANPSTQNGNSLEGFGYNAYLIDSVGYNTAKKSTIFRSNVNAGASPVGQLTNTFSTGGQTAFNFSMGANYSNKLYLGFGVGVTNLRYNTTNTFTETGHQYIDNVDYNTQYTQNQTTKGSGFNFTLGAIYKPTEALRLGLSIASPTWYVIDDNYSESLNTNYKGSNSYSDGPLNYPLSYSLRTPLKISGGAAVFFQTFGFITADVEFLDYSSIHLDNSSTTSDGYDNGSGNYNFTQDNLDIKTLYKSTVNARVGGEARLGGPFAIRAGYGIQGSPYVNKSYQDNITTISGGLGYRAGAYYIDATYANVSGSSNIYPYVLSGTAVTNPYAAVNKTYNNVFLTVGLRF